MSQMILFYFIFYGGALVFLGGAGAPASPSLAPPMRLIHSDVTQNCYTVVWYENIKGSVVMLAENSHDTEVYWKTLIGLSIQHHSNLTWSY